MFSAQTLHHALDFEPDYRFEENSSIIEESDTDIALRFVNKAPLIPINDGENISDSTIIHKKNNSTSLIDDTSQLLFFPQFPNSDYRKKEKELQWWLGKVVEVKANSFIGKLEDLQGRVNIVEFDNNIIPKKERQRISINDRFTYCIKSKESFSGRLDHSSNLNFFKRRSWKPEYENQVEETLNTILPPDFLNI